MFDMGWDEMALIGVVALIVIGPKDLPKVMREAGRWLGRARAMAAEFQNGLHQMTLESEIDTMRRDVESAMQAHAIRAEVEAAVTDAVKDAAVSVEPLPPPQPDPVVAIAPETPPAVPPEP